jgi:hypothetical protein
MLGIARPVYRYPAGSWPDIVAEALDAPVALLSHGPARQSKRSANALATARSKLAVPS